MESTLFNVLITGTFSTNTDSKVAITAFAKASKLSDEKAAELFAKAPVVVKRNLSAEKADVFCKQLLSLGIETKIEAVVVDEPQPATNSAANHNEEPSTGRRDIPFSFSGSGYQYFKIWIVNILLTIITLGIYSPWAKVRNLQYFYGNTSLDGATFSFTANPVKMLIGRLIAIAILIAYIALSSFAPLVAAVISIGFIFVFPWVLNRTLAFHARYTRHRNIAFGFSGSYGQAFVNFLLWPLAGMLTLGILFPYAMLKQQMYTISNHRYGNKTFTFHATAGNFYVMFLIAFAIVIAGIVIGALLAMVTPMLMPVAMGLGYAIAIIYFITTLKNLTFNSSCLASHNFKANYELKSFGLLLISNLLFTILTLGLFIPWAKVRLAQYAADHIQLDAASDLDSFAAISQPEESAFGEEFGDVFDMEVGF